MEKPLVQPLRRFGTETDCCQRTSLSRRRLIRLSRCLLHSDTRMITYQCKSQELGARIESIDLRLRYLGSDSDLASELGKEESLVPNPREITIHSQPGVYYKVLLYLLLMLVINVMQKIPSCHDCLCDSHCHCYID